MSDTEPTARTWMGGPPPIIGVTVVSCIQVGHTYGDHLATDHCLLIGDDGRGIAAVPAPVAGELIRRRDVQRGQTVECPHNAGVGSHAATVTHADPVGTGAPRTVVSLDCGHTVNMSDAHGLYAVPS